jgi:hypothetical protein
MAPRACTARGADYFYALDSRERMRTEIEQIVSDIEEAVTLLRRHL